LPTTSILCPAEIREQSSFRIATITSRDATGCASHEAHRKSLRMAMEMIALCDASSADLVLGGAE
jgi:hypothetical protein